MAKRKFLGRVYWIILALLATAYFALLGLVGVAIHNSAQPQPEAKGSK